MDLAAARLRFGLLVSKDDPPEADGARRVAEYVERAVAARDAGMDTIAVGHRYSYGPASADERGSPLVTSRLQPLLVLAHLAARLGDTVDYATMVLLSTSAHPVQLAEDAATLDAMCGGRLRLGLGWMPNEFEAFGVPLRGRVRRMAELVTALRLLLTRDEVDLDGDHFRLRRARLVARPVQRPAPPLWIGASAEPAVRRAARLGDTWTISAHLSIDELRPHVAAWREELARLGRPVPADRPITRVLYLAEDRDTALEEARPALLDWYRKRGEWGWFLTKGREISDDGGEFSQGRWIIGSPADCVAQLRALQAALGVTRVVFNLSPGLGASHAQRLRTIRLLGDQVLPAFREQP